MTTGLGALAVSSVVDRRAGAGAVTLVLGRIRELIDRSTSVRTKAWSLTTTAFSIGQAGAAYLYSYLFERTGSYVPLFWLAASALALALAVDIAAVASTRRRGTTI